MLPIARQVDILARLTERSRAYYDLYKFIEGKEFRPKILDQMNDYPGFFRLQGHILRYALIVELGALFEERDSVCIKRVLKRAKPCLPHELHQDLMKTIGESDVIAKKVKVLRNKAFAHRDARTDFDDAFRQAAITLDNIEKLIEISRVIVEELCKCYDVRGVCFTTENTVNDTIRLFQTLGSEIDLVSNQDLSSLFN